MECFVQISDLYSEVFVQSISDQEFEFPSHDEGQIFQLDEGKDMLLHQSFAL